ncbi:putative long chain fatty acid- CoA ligase, GNAT family [Rhodoferax antarcticus ANT.BR]|uniref:Putative long chain fatty acid-CoA ligase, GNAT family n=1 Tax=Rhodoferax antarcticus ANT.BR TaxID=1111071 RepID=A0A1Q8YFF9_9BURK|nr:putative long chain fatty acid- CoA ligase, GNAT family [Rhodoferax antarcticus ANT.BR]
MSIRNLDALFAPASVAVFGATLRPASVGGTEWLNLSADFKGRLYRVNPKHAQLGERGTRAAIVSTAGLDKAQKQAMLDAARVHTLRILGPNCICMLAPHVGLNASFSHIGALPGELAFVSQSGALVTAMLDWAGSRGIGFSHFASLGEHANIDFGDLLDFLGSDPKTRAILLYIESLEASRKFMSAARAAARNKPVIVVRAGRSVASVTNDLLPVQARLGPAVSRCRGAGGRALRDSGRHARLHPVCREDAGRQGNAEGYRERCVPICPADRRDGGECVCVL